MSSHTFRDQLSRAVLVNWPVTRIISVVPSITELLFDLGLGNKIEGRTKFCIHPKDQIQKIPRVGGTKNLWITDIIQLNPDLIIANKEENDQKQIEELAAAVPVFISDIKTLSDSYEMIESLGSIFQLEDQANRLVNELKQIASKLKSINHLKTVYLIWQNPFMTIGGDTYINDVLRQLGFVNVFEEYQRYPEITIEQIREKNPDIILLSSEPFPFKEKHIQVLKSQIPEVQISLVDGEAFSWYGSRLLHCWKEIEQWREKLVE